MYKRPYAPKRVKIHLTKEFRDKCVSHIVKLVELEKRLACRGESFEECNQGVSLIVVSLVFVNECPLMKNFILFLLLIETTRY